MHLIALTFQKLQIRQKLHQANYRKAVVDVTTRKERVKLQQN